MEKEAENSLVSIIVPIYKVEKELDRCVQSILKQTYKNIELILVDDGSPDQCPEMCDKYAKRDKRIVTIHKKNGGLSDARNAGLDIAQGEYVAFIDSDDWVSENFIEDLIHNLKDTEADISICGYIIIDDMEKMRSYTVKKEREVLEHEDSIRELFSQKKFNCMVCTKLYKKELFDKIRFPKGKLFEDIAISLPLFERCERCVITNKKMYYYFQRQEGIVNSKFTKQKLDMLEFSHRMVDYSHKHDHKYDMEAEAFYLKAVLMLLIQAYKDIMVEDAKGATLLLKNELKKHKKYIWNNAHIEKRRQIVMYAFLYGVSAKLLVKLWKIKMKTN